MRSAATAPPDRGALSGPVAGLGFIGGIGAANALADLPYPRPGTDPADVRRYFTQNPGPTRLSAIGQAISAVALARFTASVARLAGRTGRGSRALQTAAVAGGAVAAACLAASAACTAALSGWWGRQDSAAAVGPPWLPRRRGDPQPGLRDPRRRPRPGRPAHRGPAPAGGDHRAGLGVGEPARPALPRRRAHGLVHPRRTVPRPDRQRHRRRPTRPRCTARSSSRGHRATSRRLIRQTRPGPTTEA
jgi:hypothetical protein